MDQFELLKTIVTELESLDVPYLITGSVASMAYGEPRMTNDIDIVVSLKAEHIHGLLEKFHTPEYYIDEEMISSAIRSASQFNIIHLASGLKIDMIINKNTAFDQCRFTRANRLQPDASYQADFASPEDVILKKMEYYREGGSEKHLRDIAGILQISSDKIDLKYITDWVKVIGLDDLWQHIQTTVQKPTK